MRMLESSQSNNSFEIDSSLLDHAKLGLQRIHNISQAKSENQNETNGPADQPKEQSVKFLNKDIKAQPKSEVKLVKYLNIKRDIPKSIYYEHSRHGKKYWFEESKPKPYQSKIPIGRKGTLLGLVDAPYK